MTVHTVSEYIRLNELRKNTTAIIKDGKSFFVIDGNLVNLETFNKLRPKVDYQRLNPKGESIGHPQTNL